MNIEIDQFLSSIFARNKALYGDLRMEVEEKSTSPAEKAEEAPDGAPETPAGTPDKESEEEPKGEEKDKDDDLPEWARKELKDVRAEAANYRTRLREAEQKLTDAKTPEEVASAISELKEQNEKLSRQILANEAASKYGLSPFFANKLTGSTKEELLADAKAIADELGTPPPDKVSGGLDPNEDRDDERDPRKLAARFRRT